MVDYPQNQVLHFKFLFCKINVPFISKQDKQVISLYYALYFDSTPKKNPSNSSSIIST